MPGPHHQVPPCRHFPACGGCQLQHLDDDSYAGFIADRIAGALAAQGLDADDPRAASLSPPRTRRRATLHAEAKGGRIRSASARRRSHAIVDMRECHILAPELFALVAPLRALLARVGCKRARRRPSDACRPGRRPADRRASTPKAWPRPRRSPPSAERHGVARFAIDDGIGPETRWEPEPVTITLGGVPVPLPHGALPPGDARRARRRWSRRCARRSAAAATIADLFAGLGTFALSLPGQGLCRGGRARRVAVAEERGGARAGGRSSPIIATCSAAR